ncbi:Serpentine Receptor, class H [Caenorhabditis elegans]|uniref:Serpentine Receptor, class H n=1 Tax=Caenorhabditis elegans TaxID=6239 RepID=H2KYG9_CAEEL|nr:Serpentine Receptor, class H [Caenorhabditis elegans]CCD63244.1 Serpentine Receptor, class H [Caenorhabditis elegans]|eukprot:NP_001255988.1 Serpentine Receptor, class H [Caenorhabditis elegans]
MMETSYDRRALVLWFRRCSEAPNCGGAPAGKADFYGNIVGVGTCDIALDFLKSSHFFEVLAKSPLALLHFHFCGKCGILMEIHTGATWKISTSFPFPLCSNGFLGEYGPECFLILVVILIYNGLACIFIFLYRMEVASKHTAPTMLYKITHFQTYLLYFLLVMLSGITVFMYPVLKEQLDYKQRLEMKVGPIPTFMLCDSCVFMIYDSPIFLIWFLVAYICIALAYIILFSSGIVTYKALKVSRASAAVRKIQKNIFMSLVVSTITHLGLLFIPLATFFMLSLLVPEWSKSSIVKYTSDFMVIMIQQHGAVSAVTMFLTNNLLRRTAKQLFYTEMS